MKAHKVDFDRLPAGYPTHAHTDEFWEKLGRAVASFGFLEEVLLRAIVALTFTREVSDQELEAESSKAAEKLKKAVSDTLRPLIDEYE